MGQHVVVLIADIVTSRAIANRRSYQTRLARELERLSRGRKDILSPYTITLGDEFQAVLASGKSVLHDFYRLQALTRPQRVRLAVGVGPIATGVNRRMAIGMDGPAFHAARSAMSALKESGELIRLEIAGREPAPWLEPCLSLISHLLSGWRGNRIDVMAKLLEGREPGEIAKDLKLTPAAVYKNIQAGALHPIAAIAAALGEEIDNAMG